jgi:hypothetical protein
LLLLWTPMIFSRERNSTGSNHYFVVLSFRV